MCCGPTCPRSIAAASIWYEIQDPAKLDQLDGSFDLINLNAVFEHLLPAERRSLLPELWRRLANNGRLVLTETPWRWFPIETHTTSRPLMNYLPDRLALAVARRSGHYGPDLTWTSRIAPRNSRRNRRRNDRLHRRGRRTRSGS